MIKLMSEVLIIMLPSLLICEMSLVLFSIGALSSFLFVSLQ